MPKAAMWRPLHKFYLRLLLRPEPLHFAHDVFRDNVLVLALLLRQVYERHFVRFQVLHGFEYLWLVELIEAGDQALHIVELACCFVCESWSGVVVQASIDLDENAVQCQKILRMVF